MVDYRTYLVVNHFAFWGDLYAHIIGSDRIYWNGTDFAVHGDDLGHMAAAGQCFGICVQHDLWIILQYMANGFA